MNLDLVIQQLRQMVPLFNGNVGGGFRPDQTTDQGWLPPPAAYVVPLEDEAEADRDATDFNQYFTERVGVIVVIDNTTAVNAGDRRGWAAADLLDAIKWALFKAIVHWNPASVLENPSMAGTPGADRFGRIPGFYYVGMSPWAPVQGLARSIVQFNFALDRVITIDDVWQPGGVPLEGVDIAIVTDFVAGSLAGQPLETVLATEKINLQI